MGQRSKVYDLPADVRAELEGKLLRGGFSDYEGLAAWLGTKGFSIGKSSLHRYGSVLEERMNALKVATEQAKALVEASPDDAGDMGAALIRLVQERVFSTLMQMEIDPENIDLAKIGKVIAPLVRADVHVKKYAAEWRAKTAKVVDELAQAQGMDASQAEFWMRKFLGVPGAA